MKVVKMIKVTEQEKEEFLKRGKELLDKTEYKSIKPYMKKILDKNAKLIIALGK